MRCLVKRIKLSYFFGQNYFAKMKTSLTREMDIYKKNAISSQKTKRTDYNFIYYF